MIYAYGAIALAVLAIFIPNPSRAKEMAQQTIKTTQFIFNIPVNISIKIDRSIHTTNHITNHVTPIKEENPISDALKDRFKVGVK